MLFCLFSPNMDRLNGIFPVALYTTPSECCKEIEITSVNCFANISAICLLWHLDRRVSNKSHLIKAAFRWTTKVYSVSVLHNFQMYGIIAQCLHGTYLQPCLEHRFRRYYNEHCNSPWVYYSKGHWNKFYGAHTGTGTKFGGYLSSSPTLNDNISLEKLSNFTLNANYIHYLSLWFS